MDYPIEHPDFEGRNLVLRGYQLVVDGQVVPGKRGRFDVRDNQGQTRVIQLKSNGIDPIPKIILGEETILLVRPLAWYEYLWMGLPIALVFVGGALGAALGAAALYASARVFRSERTPGARYALSGLISLGAVSIYAVGVFLITTATTDMTSKKTLEEVARNSNRELPRELDQITQLSHLEGLEGVLVYHYRLNTTPGEVSPERLAAQLGPTVVANTCGDPETQERFLGEGVTIRHVYTDREGSEIARFDVGPEDCPEHPPT